MARATEEKALIEAERLRILHGEQRKLRKRIQREIKVKKAGHMPGEEHLKKNVAVLLKVGVPNISYTEIAERLGETKTTVKKWFQSDPHVKEQYEFVIANLKDGALELLKTYSLEAVETLALLMRYGGEKYMFEAAREILDRIGVPRISRSEIEAEHKRTHEWTDRDALAADIRELPPEEQEEALEAIEKLEKMLMTAPGASKNGNESSNELPPIMNIDDEEEDDENG